MGCGKSKHAIATTESFSTYKKQNRNSTKKIQNVEVPNETKTTNIEENNNIIRSETLDVAQNPKTATNAIHEEDLITKQGEENNTSLNDIKMDIPFQSKEKQENNDILVEEVIAPKKVKESPLDESMNVNHETKSDEIISPQHVSIEKVYLDEGKKQDILQEDNNDANEMTKSDENLSQQHDQLSIEKVISNDGEKEGVFVEGNNELLNKTNSKEENLTSQRNSIDNFTLPEEDKQEDLGSGLNNENIEDGNVNTNEISGEVKVESASIEDETTPKAGQNDVMIAKDEKVDTAED